MTGCLTLPFRMAATLMVVVGLVAGWVYRDDLVRFGRRQLGLAEPQSPIGHPAPGTLEGVRARLDRVARGTTDSVVLTPSDLATLAVDLLQRGAGAPDSVEVELRDREIAIRARVSTAPLPGAVRDLLGGVLGDREMVQVAGPLGLRRAGVGEFEVRQVRVRGLPVPRDLVARLLAPYLPRTEGGVVLFEVPEGITGIRVTPRGVTLYGRRGG